MVQLAWQTVYKEIKTSIWERKKMCLLFLSWLFGNSNQESDEELDDFLFMEMMEEEDDG